MRINSPFVFFEKCQLVGLPHSTPLSLSPLKISPNFRPNFIHTSSSSSSSSDPPILTMKRSMSQFPDPSEHKKLRFQHSGPNSEHSDDPCENGFSRLDENLLYEVLKHADARTLAVASCVNKTWHRTAQDERLWELICTRHWPNINCGTERLRSVVLALGGFRRLHALYLCKTAPASPSAPPIPAAFVSASPPPMAMIPQPKGGNKRWGKDEVHLSLSLLSIRYYEKMHFGNRNSK